MSYIKYNNYYYNIILAFHLNEYSPKKRITDYLFFLNLIKLSSLTFWN